MQLCSLNVSHSTQLWHVNMLVVEESWEICCWLLDFFLYFFSFCCLIVLVQSQSLSRRTTPFAPRVQVMGPVWRALSLWSLLIHFWPAFFCFHSLENAFLGKWQLWVSLSVQLIYFLNLISQLHRRLLLLILTQSHHCSQVVHVQLI